VSGRRRHLLHVPGPKGLRRWIATAGEEVILQSCQRAVAEAAILLKPVPRFPPMHRLKPDGRVPHRDRQGSHQHEKNKSVKRRRQGWKDIHQSDGDKPANDPENRP
jgi:hypothetical protein